MAVAEYKYDIEHRSKKHQFISHHHISSTRAIQKDCILKFQPQLSIQYLTMSADTLSLKGKVAIVSGSGRENGIGAGIAVALARNGAAVAINYVSESTANRAADVAESIRKVGGKATHVQADLTTLEGAKKLVEETLKAFSVDHIDILGEFASMATTELLYSHP